MTSLVIRPIIIDEIGLYKTRSGEVIKIESLTPKNKYHCRGSYPNGINDLWHRSGRLLPFTECQNDIVEKVR